MDTKKFKIKDGKTGGIIVGAMLVIPALLLELGMIAVSDNIIETIASSIIPIGFFLILGIGVIISAINKGKRVKRILEKYGEENIRKNILENAEFVFEFKKEKVYFTDKFVYGSDGELFEYREICWMYKHIFNNQGIVTVSVAFRLEDGENFFLCSHVSEEEIPEIMLLCKKHNPNIVFGYSDEMEKKHKEAVKKFKKTSKN